VDITQVEELYFLHTKMTRLSPALYIFKAYTPQLGRYVKYE
jgi:hypothetical protein